MMDDRLQPSVACLDEGYLRDSGIHIDFLDKYFLASMSYRCVTDRSNARTINCTAGLI